MFPVYSPKDTPQLTAFLLEQHGEASDLVDAEDRYIALIELAARLEVSLALKGYRVFKDGDKWCAVGLNFKDLQESLSGFGDSPVAALGELIVEEKEAEILRRTSLRQWKCTNCTREFCALWAGDHAPCPVCKAGAQYTFAMEPT